MGFFDNLKTKISNKNKYKDIISKLDITFPFECDVNLRRSDIDRINNRLEKMPIGEKLVIVPEMQNDEYDFDVSTEVFDQDGLLLGWCSNGYTTAELYKVKDILVAEVIAITPVSKRRKGSKYSLLRIKIDYDFGDSSISDSNVENKYTVIYSADGESGAEHFPNIYAARRYIEHLMGITENGYSQILDEDDNEIPDEGAVWC